MSKTGTLDDAVILDGADSAWLGPTYTEMKRGDQMSAAAMSIAEKRVPYQLRHSGPSWERLRDERSLQYNSEAIGTRSLR